MSSIQQNDGALANALSSVAVEKLNSPEVKRIANISQIYFLDYYFDLLSYLHARKERLLALQKKKEILSPESYHVAWKNYTGRERAALRKKRTRIRNGDFQTLTQVGQGGYGQVYLARKVDTKEICALKVMNKKHLAVLDEVRHVLTERDILTVSDSPWLVKLLYAFQDEESIYFAMEFVAGGDFRTLLNNARVLRNQHCRFYIAEMFMCVNALHSLGYIHRDLKPENFLIDSSGHLKLTDFGLSAGIMNPEKINRLKQRLESVKDTNVPRRSSVQKRQLYESVKRADKAYATSIVGSPDYMAPEILKGEGYDFSVDFWSLGCILYEALAGYPPFVGANIDETWSNLKHWESTFAKPENEDGKVTISDTTWSFLLRLICKPASRFKDILQVQTHPYFSSIDWPNIRKANPPFIPELDSDVDAGYFDDFSNEDDMAKYKDVQIKQQHLEDLASREAGKEMDMSKAAFVGFTYRRRKEPVKPGRNTLRNTDFSTML